MDRARIELFLRLRDLSIYVYVKGKRRKLSEGEQRFIDHMKTCIEKGIPSIKVELAKVRY